MCGGGLILGFYFGSFGWWQLVVVVVFDWWQLVMAVVFGWWLFGLVLC